MNQIIISLAKKFLSDRKWVLICFIAALAFAGGLFLCSGRKQSKKIETDTPSYQIYEIDRTERILETIDGKAKAEVKANEKISIDDDYVLDTLDALLRKRGREDPVEKK